MQTSTLALLGGGIVAVSVAAAVYLRPLQDEIRAERAAEAEAAQAAATAEQPEASEPADQSTASQSAESAPAQAVTEAEGTVASEAEASVSPQAPVLTTLRFEPDGAVLVSGTAPPQTEVSVRLDGQELERIAIGADGTFFFTGFLGFSDGPRMLSVIGDPDGAALDADRSFVLAANPAPVSQGVEPVTTAEGAETVNTPLVSETPAEGAEVAEAAPETAVSTPAILAVTEEGVEVVQAPAAADVSPEVMSTVALDTITYDEAGEVQLQGRALGQGFVQVYVDNAPVSRLPVDDAGGWRGDLPDVDKGVYTLRIDEIDADGDVVSRIETPFLREDPATVAEALAEEVEDPSFTVATRTVQPGATLWAIAEERYGSGVLYVTVFEANQDRIRNPDLIYPGQVFLLPEDGN